MSRFDFIFFEIALIKIKVCSAISIQVLYVLCFYKAQVSCDRLQDDWSPGIRYVRKRIDHWCTVEPGNRNPRVHLWSGIGEGLYNIK